MSFDWPCGSRTRCGVMVDQTLWVTGRRNPRELFPLLLKVGVWVRRGLGGGSWVRDSRMTTAFFASLQSHTTWRDEQALRMKNIHNYFTDFYVILNCRENQQIKNFYDIWLPWKSPSKSPLCSLAFFKSSNNSLLCHVQGHKRPHNLQKWTHAFLNFLNFTGSVFIFRHS